MLLQGICEYALNPTRVGHEYILFLAKCGWSCVSIYTYVVEKLLGIGAIPRSQLFTYMVGL